MTTNQAIEIVDLLVHMEASTDELAAWRVVQAQIAQTKAWAAAWKAKAKQQRERIAELETALTVHLAVAADDPILEGGPLAKVWGYTRGLEAQLAEANKQIAAYKADDPFGFDEFYAVGHDGYAYQQACDAMYDALPNENYGTVDMTLKTLVQQRNDARAQIAEQGQALLHYAIDVCPEQDRVIDEQQAQIASLQKRLAACEDNGRFGGDTEALLESVTVKATTPTPQEATAGN